MSVDAYFATGTGRCGSRLLAELLSASANSSCRHEFSISYTNLQASFHSSGDAGFDGDIRDRLLPAVKEDHDQGRVFGDSSGLAYLAFPRLARMFGETGRFMLLVRHPATFVPSALARGFFDPQHPHALEHLRPRDGDPLLDRWTALAPAERCLWYWNLVNSYVLDFFDGIDPTLWRVVRQESFSVEVVEDLYAFLGLSGFDRAKVGAILGRRINATPGLGDDSWVNPWSVADRSLPTGWWKEFPKAWGEWAEPLLPRLYP